MKMKKVMALCLTAVVGMGVLSGCGSTKSEFRQYAKCAEVKDYDGIEYVPTSREVTQDQIDEKINSFCTDNNVETKDYDSVIKDGDDVNINYVETINGEEKAKNDDEAGTSIVMGKDALAPGLDEQMIGLKPGVQKTFTITYPDDYSDTTVAGMEAKFDVTINYIKITTTPEYTDDLVKSATDGKYTTTADYTKYLTDELQKDADKSADNTDRANVLKAIKEKTTFTKYPEGEIDAYVKSVMDNIESSASQYGIGVPTFLQYFYGYTDEASFVSYLQSTVESVMQEKIVVSSIALEKDLVANDKETDAYKQKLMDDNEVDEDTINSKYSASDLKFYATEEKVLDYLMGAAVQVDSTEASSEDASEASSEDASEDGSTEAESTESTTESASEAE